MTNEKYNGWANYETWLTKLWMDNDYSSYQYYQELAKKYKEEHKERNDQIYHLSKRIEEEMEENTPETSGLYCDLLNSALSKVKWYEIAEHLIDEIEG